MAKRIAGGLLSSGERAKKRLGGFPMEKVYRTSGGDSLREMNDEIAEYDGHVVMISTAPDKDWGPVAYVVVDYPNETPPKKD